MKKQEFNQFDNFTYDEVISTGANVELLRIKLFHHIQNFRNTIKRKVIILKNGLNSGVHKSLLHPSSEAIDFMLDPAEGPVDVNYIVSILIQSGFQGIGVYWNGKVYSFHADLRYLVALWKADKTISGKWYYQPLLSSDPGELLKHTGPSKLQFI